MTTNGLFEQAQLAEASYADLWDEGNNLVIKDDTKVREALETYSFSSKKGTDLFLAN